jgi:tRNA 2-selenouridine synthase
MESLAHHKGSVFGALGEEAQNSNEQFENDLFTSLAGCNPDKPVWVEDESQNIGKNLIPAGFFRQILNSPMICIETDFQSRIDRLVRDYAEYSPESLALCINKISKRLGSLTAKSAIEYLGKKDFRRVAEFMLDYYDQTYSYSLKKRNPHNVFSVKINSSDLQTSSDIIIKWQLPLI